MKKSFENYQRIAKTRMSSLWVGDDHLVYVKGSGFVLPFTERYSRFRLRDNQCLAITDTNRTGKIILYLFATLGFFGIIAAIFSARGGSIPTFSTPGDIATWVFISLFTLVGLLFLFFLIRTLVLGPTCKTNLTTNLKCEHLKPLNRVRKATQATEMLAELIEKAQRDS